jgi:hypothetical protein
MTLAVASIALAALALAFSIWATHRADHTCWICGADTSGGKPHRRGCTREAAR